jgi:L-ascorbate metabolism protein UlaG (beta-lactamase superfamily)
LNEEDSERTEPVLTVSYVADTRYFLELAEHYRADVVIMNVVRLLPSDLDHLHVHDAEELVKAIRPRLTVLSHFGMKMLAAKPWIIAREMSERTGCQVVAATDGMLIDLEQYKGTNSKPQTLNPMCGVKATNSKPQTLNPKPEGAE